MDLLLRRRDATDGRTLGQLFVNGRFAVFTLEDAVRPGPKVMHETAIPTGRYRIEITPSARFGRLLPIVCDVPGFSGIRIHPGNTAADTSGCILVGLSIGYDRIGASRAALEKLQPLIADALARGEGVWLTVVDPLPAGAQAPLNA